MNIKKMQINCALITIAPFPIGNVSTIRYSSYLKSLCNSGIKNYVFIISPTYMARHNLSKSGVHEGIYYDYMTKIAWRRNEFFIIKVLYYILGLIKSIFYLKKYKINCVILYHQETFAYYFYWLFLKLFSITFLTDKSEYPYGYSKMSWIRKKLELIKLKVFDGFIVMTHELFDFYSRSKSKKASIFHLPMTIDLNRYSNIIDIEVNEPYIAVVFGSHNRDGLYESIITYNHYRKLAKEKSFKLVLIGDYSRLPEWETIHEYLDVNNLLAHVEIKGLLPINEVPSILKGASCLLTTPNEYISGGFPTKLGEYLLSGVPVVATSVGEISKYLTNNIHAFLLEPKDYNGLSEKIFLLQNNPSIAHKMAYEAKKLVLTTFNSDIYAESLKEFLIQNIRRKKPFWS